MAMIDKRGSVCGVTGLVVLLGRTVLFVCIVLGGSVSVNAMKRADVDFEFVVKKAEKLAKRSYSEGKKTKRSDAALELLDYDAYRKIQFRQDESLWRQDGLPFQVQFFHPGYLYRDSVRLNEFTATHVQRIPFMKSLYRYGSFDDESLSESSLEYAGFRVQYPLKGRGKHFDEVISFLGASYFRAIGNDMHYGLSARGLTINAGLSTPEEFPRFVEFWLGKPEGESTEMVIFALMDSPSVVGVYRFVVAPGEITRVDVKSRLFMREDVDSFGVAPLTSMFWYGENSSVKGLDYRPEVHDTDGLLIESSEGKRSWRPLEISDKTRLSYFQLDDPAGFGFMQRDQAFSSYEDLEAEYHKRPSLWIIPQGDWGKGHLKLVELPTSREYDDNVISFWEPTILPSKGDVLDFEYSMLWTVERSPGESVASDRAASTRVGYDQSSPGDVLFVIDFEEGEEGRFNEGNVPVADAKVLANGSLSHVNTQWNPYSETWRVSLRVYVGETPAGPLELSCCLKFPEGEDSETWLYQWTQ